jgi:hypothetical protein
MVANKTLYTLASANQNSIYIAGLGRETLYTLAARHENSIHFGAGRDRLMAWLRVQNAQA